MKMKIEEFEDELWNYCLRASNDDETIAATRLSAVINILLMSNETVMNPGKVDEKIEPNPVPDGSLN